MESLRSPIALRASSGDSVSGSPSSGLLQMQDGEATTVGLVLNKRIVQMVMEGSPAHVAGTIDPLDEIIAVDGIPVNNQTVVASMRGIVGSRVCITIQKAKTGRIIDVILVRQRLWGPRGSPEDVDRLEVLRGALGAGRSTEVENLFVGVLKQLSSTQMQLESWKSEAEVAREKLAAAESKLQMLKAATIRGSLDGASDGDVMATTRAQLVAAQAARDQLEAQVVQLQAQMRREVKQLAQTEIDRQRADFEDHLSELEGNAVRLANELKTKTEECSVAQESIARLEEQLRLAQLERSQLQIQLEAKSNELSVRVAELVVQKGAAEGRSAEQSVEIERLLLDIERLRAELREADRQLGLKGHSHDGVAAIEAMQTSLLRMEEELRSERESNALLRQRQSEYTSKLEAKLEALSAERQAELAALQQRLREVTQKKDAAEGRAEEQSGTIRTLEEQLKLLRSQYAAMEKDVAVAQSELDRQRSTSRERIERLEQQLLAAEARLAEADSSSLRDRIAQLQAELHALRTIMESHEKELAQARADSASARAAADERVRTVEAHWSSEQKGRAQDALRAQERIARLEEQLRAAESAATRAQARFDAETEAANARVERVVESKAAIETKYSELVITRDTLRADLSRAEQATLAAERAAAQARHETERIRAEMETRLSASESLLSASNIKVADLERRLRELEAANLALDSNFHEQQRATRRAEAAEEETRAEMRRQVQDAADKIQNEIAKRESEAARAAEAKTALLEKIARLEEQLRGANSVREALETRYTREINESSNRISELVSAKGVAEGQVEELSVRCSQMASDLKSAHAALSEAKADAIKYQGDATRAAEEAAGLVKKLERSKTETSDALAAKAAAEGRADERNRRITSMQQEIDHLRAELERWREQAERIQRDFDLFRNGLDGQSRGLEAVERERLARLTESEAKLRSELRSLEEQLREAIKACAHSEGKVSQCERQISSLETEIVALRAQLAQAQAATAAELQAKLELEVRLQLLTEQLRTAEDNVRNFEKTAIEHTRLVSNLQAQLTEATGARERAVTDRARTEESLRAATTQISKLERDIAALRDQLLKAQSEDSSERAVSAESQLVEARELIASLRRELEVAHTGLLKNEQQIGSLRSTVLHLENLNKSLENKFGTASITIDELHIRIARMDEQIIASDSARQTAISEADDSARELGECRRNCARLEARIEELLRQIQDQQSEAVRREKELHATIEKLRDELRSKDHEHRQAFERANNDWHRREQDLLDKLARVEEQLSKETAERKSLSTQLDKALAENSETARRAFQAESREDEVRKQLELANAEHKSTVRDLRAEIDRLRLELGKAREAAEQAKADALNGAQGREAELLARIAHLERALMDAESAREAAEAATREAMQENAELSRTRGHADGRVQQLLAELEHLRSELETVRLDMREEADRWRSEADRVREEAAELRDLLRASKNEIEIERASCVQLREDVHVLNSDRERLRQELENRTRECHQLVEARGAAEGKAEELSRRLAALEREHDALKIEYKQANRLIQELQAELAMLKAELKALQMDVVRPAAEAPASASKTEPKTPAKSGTQLSARKKSSTEIRMSRVVTMTPVAVTPMMGVAYAAVPTGAEHGHAVQYGANSVYLL